MFVCVSGYWRANKYTVGKLTKFRVSENTCSVMKGAQFIQSEQDTRHTLRETKNIERNKTCLPRNEMKGDNLLLSGNVPGS